MSKVQLLYLGISNATNIYIFRVNLRFRYSLLMTGRLLAICRASSEQRSIYLQVIVVQLLFAKGEMFRDVTRRTRVFTHSGCQVAGGLPDVAGLASRNPFVDNVAVEHLPDLSAGRAVLIFRNVNQLVLTFSQLCVS